MLTYLFLAILGLASVYVYQTYRSFSVNLAAAKQSGIPYICTPVYTFNRFWLVTHRLWLPFIKKLPSKWIEGWVE